MADRTREQMKEEIRRRVQGGRKAMSAEKMASLLRVRKSERARFLQALAQMERNGELVRKRGRYQSPRGPVVHARLMALQRGYGFARPEEGGADIFIAGRDLGGALPGDALLLRLASGDSRGPSGRVVEITERSGRFFTGRLTEENGQRVVKPDAFIRYPVPVWDGEDSGAALEDKVRFAVEQGEDGRLSARVITIYGSADSARVCADSIIDAAGIPVEFPDEVREQAEKYAQIPLTDALNGREDWRDWLIFTIDGRDAKDLDDAVSLEQMEDGGWRLGVHIADVSHYVPENSPLDEETRRRGTSVYFADRVIPMLPTSLSNGACSLHPGEDKLALSAVLTMDKGGICTDVSIRKTVVRSCLRGVYDEVNALFEGNADQTLVQKYQPVRDTLENMRTLARTLRDNAAARGTLDLISMESAFTLDEEGHPVDVSPRTTGESEGLIEQFMIAANVAVTSFSRKQGLPFVYRVHENPDPEKLQILGEVAQRLGFKTTKLESPTDLRALMGEARQTPYARLISDFLLRSMAKAAYSEKPLGHYGLSQTDYCHFTSPIRRYPDLCVHRILTAHLSGVPREEVVRRYTGFVKGWAELSSECEVRAVTAERDCEDCYKAEYMGRFIGEEFSGVISSVSAFGLFVELPNSVEGLVRLDELPEDTLVYDGIASLTNRRGRPVYTVGEEMRVQVQRVDVSAGQIDFAPVFTE